MCLFLVALLLVSCATATAEQNTSSTNNETTTGRAIQNKGSDTLVNIALAWAERYREIRPDVSIAVTGGGSGTGIASLINGTVDIANASRAMKDSEIEEAQANGINPVEHTVAIDALAVIVHPDNPVEKLTIKQLSDIFTGRITNWKEVGGHDAAIVILSRETNSGTHVYFLEEVVRQGDGDNTDIFAPQTLLMPSSVGITSELGRNVNAIGYDGLGYVTEHEKVLAVAVDEESPYILPTVETASTGTYPLARDLYMYTAGEPTGEIAIYLEWLMGAEGQEIVRQLGFVPLNEVE
ncbi:MAG: PstS family phosphate ABC transporter substrate-binding protein [Anaerolineales bacterium]|nr:PstS family phosphate ABC transporter substrate-binding protein [Anaerolineales bacterium]